MEAKEKFYDVVRLHKDDLRDCYENDKKALKSIDNLTDEQMEYIAEKFGDAIMEDWREILRAVFDYRVLNKR